MTVSGNGERSTDPGADGQALDALRARPENPHLLRGYGPLVVGIVLLVLMVALAPTVAPEQMVERPVGTTEAPTVATTTSSPAEPVSSETTAP